MQIISKQLRDTLHPASLLFIQRMFETSPVQPNSDEIKALDFLTTALISTNLWSKFRAIYPLVGRSGPSMSINLKNPYRHTIVWYNSLIFDKNGVTNTGTGYGNTFVAPSWFSDNDIHVSVYNATRWYDTSAECALIGSTPDPNSSSWMHTISLRRRPQTFIDNDPSKGILQAPIFTYSCGTFPPFRGAGVDAGDQLNAQAWGLIVGVNGIYCYTGGEKLGAYSLLSNAVSSRINPTQLNSFNEAIPTFSQYPFLLLTHRAFGSVAQTIKGQTEQTAKANIRFATIGTALDDYENKIFYDIVEEFQTILRRNVGTFRLGESEMLVDETNPRVAPSIRIDKVTTLTSRHLYPLKDEIYDRFKKENQCITPTLSINKIEVFGPRRLYLSDSTAASINIMQFTEI
jgi:hypothetical protein